MQELGKFNSKIHVIQGCIQAVWETGIPVWASKLWHLKNAFQVFFLQWYFNKKYVELVINDFSLPLVISQWLSRQKCRQKTKTIRKERRQDKRRNCLRKSVHLNKPQ